MPWTNETSLNNPRQGLAAATCDAPAPGLGYRVYAVGGNDGTGPVGTVEAYDTLAKTWSPIAPLNTPRANLAAVSGPARLYAFGGTDGIGPLNAHEIYNPAGNDWAAAPALPTARSGLAGAAGENGLIYAIGGFNGSPLGTVEAFNPASNAWGGALKPMPTPRYGLAAVTGPDGMIYAIAGQGGGGIVNTVEVYNPASNAWTTTSPLPAARFGLAAAVGPDGLIYAFGGIDGNGIPQNTVYSYDPGTKTWTAVASLTAPQAFLAGDAGPDGLIYAIGGMNFTSQALDTVEAFTVATAITAPDPYIGNGTYQSPDIALLGSGNSPVPIGGAPMGAWDTLLQPNKHYGIQVEVYNDSPVAAINTIVRFWHFPGGVGTAGALIDTQTVTVPANGSIVVVSANPFQSGPLGAHECVAVSIANAQSMYFNVDPAMATDVIDPTMARPAGSGHYGSAWRNTNSSLMGAAGQWRFLFGANWSGSEAVAVTLAATATKAAVGWDRTGAAAALRTALTAARVDLRQPLFLVPELRAKLPAADLALKIELPGADKPATAKQQITVRSGKSAPFTVSGTIPKDAKPGDIFLVKVIADYAATRRSAARSVEYLQVIYVK